MRRLLYRLFNLIILCFSLTEIFGSPTTDIVSVHPHSGQMQYELPLYTIEDPDFKWPLSVSYLSDGYLPLEYSDPIGYGWELIAGGCISRQIIGIADDYGESTGGLRGAGILFYYRNPNWDNSLWDIGTSTDSGSDIYSFNFGGYSGSFVITGSNQVNILSGDFVQVDISGLAIINHTNRRKLGASVENPASSIVITTMDGYKYYFGGDVNTIECAGVSEDGAWWYPYICSWLLKKVEAPSGSTMTFFYRERNNNLDQLRYDPYLTWRKEGSESSLSKVTFCDTLDVRTRPQYYLAGEQGTISQYSILDSISVSPTALGVKFEYVYLNNNISNPSYSYGGARYIPKPFVNKIRVSHNSRILQQWYFNHQREIFGPEKPIFLIKATNLAGEEFSFEYDTDIPNSLEIPNNDVDIDLYGYSTIMPQYGSMVKSRNAMGAIHEYYYSQAIPVGIRILQISDNIVSTCFAQSRPSFCSSIHLDSICVKDNHQIYLAKKYHYQHVQPNLQIGSATDVYAANSGVLTIPEVFLCNWTNNPRLAYSPFQRTKRGVAPIGYTYVWENVHDYLDNSSRQTLYQYNDNDLSIIFSDFSLSSIDALHLQYIIDITSYFQYSNWFSKLVSKQRYVNFSTLLTEENVYYRDNYDGHYTIRLDHCYWQDIPVTQRLIASRVTKDYEQTGIMQKTSSYEYDSNYRLTKSTLTCGDETHFVRYVYADNLVPPSASLFPLVQDSVYHGLKKLISLGAINTPIEQYEGFIRNGGEYVTAGKLSLPKITTYTLSRGSWMDVTWTNYLLYPTQPIGNFSSARYGTFGSVFNSNYDLSSVKTYSRWNRLVYEKSVSDIYPTTYTWGTDRYMPLTKTINNHVWQYTYLPYVGITSEQDPRGVSLYYQYDNIGRLFQTYTIEDEQKHIIKQYEYR